jgi:beta-glucosidase
MDRMAGSRASFSRRAVLGGAALLPVLPRLAQADTRFPKDFIWGVSTSSAQIEGAADVDGKSPSIWDVFAKQPGKIADGGTPEVACDHYHRFEEDIALMKELGIGAYRFSIAWPRVIPNGTGEQNEKGWAFYDRLVDGLLAAGIRPMPCLYHWDLPQALQEKGGWLSRDSAGWLADYALAALKRLGDRVDTWFILNEAAVHAYFGHGTGEHAPGIGGGPEGVLQALHHQNLAQATALRALRQARANLTLGTVLSLQPVVPETDRQEDRDAAIRWDAMWNRVTLDGLMRGAVPEVLAPAMGKVVQPDDLALIKTPIDVLGMNYYSRFTVRHEPGRLFDVGWGKAHTDRFTAYGWPVEPEGIAEMLRQLKALYGNPPVLITENGAAYADDPSGGRVRDDDRIAFLRDHLKSLQLAIDEGCNVKGYMAWSLLDNFEWQMGYRMRFGLVYVDFARNQSRVPKASYTWFRAVAGTGIPA